MNDARRRRGAKQDRRDARRARKRRPISADDDFLITTIRSALAEHPVKLLAMASYVISLATPERKSSATSPSDGTRSLEVVISHLAQRQCRETSALLAVVAELLVDDEVLRERCREESSKRHDHLPKWIVGLPHVEMRRAVRRAHVLGDGDELAIGLVLADATELTLGAFLDHNILSAVSDFEVLADPLDEALDRARERVDPATTFIEMDPADARSWIERGLDQTEYISRSDEWRQALPLVRWMIAQLPGGGTAYERPEWDDDAISGLLDAFLSSSAGAPFSDIDYRDFLRQLCDTGSGDPWRWSASRLSSILRSSISYYDVPLEIALDAPALLRAYVPFAHVDSGIRQDLTDEAIATIDELSLRYRRKLLHERTDYYDEGDIAPPPWITYPDRAS
jgi:predicted secreted protein